MNDPPVTGAKSETHPYTRRLWPWVAATLVFVVIAIGFYFWWPMHKANRLLNAIEDKGGHFGHSNVNPDWQVVFGDQIHPWLHDVEWIRLNDKSMSDPEIRDLSVLRGLRDLALNISRNSPEAVNELGRLNQLQFLTLQGNGDELPSGWISSLPDLNELSLSHLAIPEESWREIVGSNAEFVLLYHCQVRTETASKLSTGSTRRLYLEELELSRNLGEELQALALKELTINNCRASEGFWKALNQNSNLETLITLSIRKQTHTL